MHEGDQDILVAAAAIVRDLSPAQRKRLTDRRVYFLKIPTYRLRELVDAVDALDAATDEAGDG